MKIQIKTEARYTYFIAKVGNLPQSMEAVPSRPIPRGVGPTRKAAAADAKADVLRMLGQMLNQGLEIPTEIDSLFEVSDD